VQRQKSNLTVDLSVMPRVEDIDHEAATIVAEDFITTESEAVTSKEDPKLPESKASTTKVRRSGCMRNSDTLVCLRNVLLLIKIVSSAEWWSEDASGARKTTKASNGKAPAAGVKVKKPGVIS
jgi:hypothetical protein